MDTHMKIGYDAKRAYHNVTGLGNYSRTLIDGMATFYPSNEYYLFNPSKSTQYQPQGQQIIEINPSSWLSNVLPALWRRSWMLDEIEQKVNLFHGLSHELPRGIEKRKVKSVVTIHDLIFEHLPDQYRSSDRMVYRSKFKYASEVADKIIAISASTKKDLVELYGIDESKIAICYQACDQRYYRSPDPEQYERIKTKYHLPEKYFLSIGSIIERKNLLNTCKAFFQLNRDDDTKLVVIGKGGKYKELVKDFIQEQGRGTDVIFLDEHYSFDEINRDLPAIYFYAKALVYPSLMEGFGIPIVEAMASKTAVITSNCSSLVEAGGDAALLVDPHDVSSIAEAMQQILEDTALRHHCIEKGNEQVKKFSNYQATFAVMEVYKSLVK